MRRRKRDRLRASLRRIGERRRNRRMRFPGKRRTKRKAALALSASVLAMDTGIVASAGWSQPASAAGESVQAIDPTTTRVHARTLSISDDFKQALIEEEGVRQTVYRDVAGYPTVGVGHLVTPQDGLRVGDRIGYDRVLDLLDQDLATAERAVERLVGDLKLYQHEYDALVDLVYNVGEGNVSEAESPRLNAAIADADYDAIADELDYRQAGGASAKGLALRSIRRTQIFLDGAYENPRDRA